MRFLIDAQLPPALARWFEEHGHEASAVRDVDLRGAKDTAIWNMALQFEWVIVTKDEDFTTRIAQSIPSHAPQILWLRIGNCTNRVLLAWLEPLLPRIIEALSADHRLVEVRHSER